MFGRVTCLTLIEINIYFFLIEQTNFSQSVEPEQYIKKRNFNSIIFVEIHYQILIF